MPIPDLSKKCLWVPHQWWLLNPSFHHQDVTPVLCHPMLEPSHPRFFCSCLVSESLMYCISPTLLSMAYPERDRVRWSRSKELRSKHSSVSHEGKYIFNARKTPKIWNREQVKSLWNALTIFRKIKQEMLLLCLHSKYRRNALETLEITQNPWVCCERHLVKVVHREIKLLTTERGKELSRVFVAESCFYFKYCFVNMFVLLLCSEMLAQRKIPACWVLTKGHLAPTGKCNKLTSFPG